MKLEKGRSYSADNTDLKIKIMQIYSDNEERIIFRGLLVNKYNGIIYENRKYRIEKSKIGHWKPWPVLQ